MLKARLLRVGESLPSGLDIQFPSIDPVWTWVVADNDNNIIAALISAPGPGIAILLKICSLKGTSSTVMLRLLRKSLTDMAARGYRAYMVCLDKDREMEAKLAAIAIKAGSLVVGKGIIIAGPTDIKRW